MSGSQASFCAAAASAIRDASLQFEAAHPDLSSQNSKFIGQIQLFLHATDAAVMLPQLKLALSARPASNLVFGDKPEQHPIHVTIRHLCQLFFDYAPRTIIKELLRLLTFLMTPVAGAEIIPNSVCVFTRAQFLAGWQSTLNAMESSSSLLLDAEIDVENAEQLAKVKSAVESLDILWSVLPSNTPSIVPLLDDAKTVDSIWCFLARIAQLSSRDQRLEIGAQIFSHFVVESFLASVHAFIKLHPLRERLYSDFSALATSVGLELDTVVEQMWYTRESFDKLSQAALPASTDVSYGGSSILIFGALLHGTISLLSSRHCTKETTQSAGMLVAVLSSELLFSIGRDHAAWIQSQFVLGFLPSFAATPSLSQYSILNTLPAGPQPNGPGSEPYERHVFSPQFVDSLPLVAIQSAIRGLLVCFQSQAGLLVAPCAALREIRPHIDETSPFTDTQTPAIEPSSILFDGALTYFLRNAEASHDRHSRLMGVRSAGTCVDVLLKALNSENLLGAPVVSHYLKIKVESCMERLFELIWKNWEDPFDSIVSEICLMFPLLLDVAERAFQIFGASANLGPDFVDKLASHLLNVDISTKGKYPLLNLLIQRIGPARLLQIKPTFVEDLFKASSYSIAGRSVGPCIQSMLNSIHALIQPTSGSRDKKKSKNKSDKVEPKPAASSWTVDPISLFTLPIISALLDPETQMPITAYALPTAFELFPATFSSSLRLLTSDITGASIQEFDLPRIKAILSVLKVGRSVGLIENSALLLPSFFPSSLPALQGLLPRLVGEALTSNDIFCRVDALQLLIETRKLSELPVSLELESILRNTEYNMVETSLTYRNRWSGVLDQILVRLKDSLKHHSKIPARSLAAQQTLARDSRNAVSFINELASALLHCLYSAAPPHRRLTALESLRSIVTKFGPTPAKGCSFVPYIHIANASDEEIVSAPIGAHADSDAWKKLEVFSPAATLSLLVGLWDQYDSARTLSFEVLKQFPAPLPGFESADNLKPMMRWILNSISSPRMREADAGSLALRLIVSTYIIRSGWSLRMQLKNQGEQLIGHVDALPPSDNSPSVTERLVAFCNDLLDIVLVHVAETRKSRQFAAMNFPVHGPLMAVRYLINDVNVASLNEASNRHWRTLVLRIMEVSKAVSALALELKYPLRYTHNDMGEVDHTNDHDMGDGDDEDALEPELADIQSELPKDTSTSDSSKKPAQKESTAGGTTEGVIVAMWLSLKEVSFLLGCLVKSCIAAASADFAASLKRTNSSAAAATAASISTPLPLSLLTATEIRDLGQHLLDNLLVLRHRGAMETTGEGFQAICESILSTNDRSLHAIVHTWLAQLLTRIDDTPWALLSTRRSAGLPYAFLAILRSETNVRASRTFLPIVFSHLIATASRTGWSSQGSQASLVEKIAHAGVEEEDLQIPEVVVPAETEEKDADVGKGTEANHSPKEHRHQVHAFNVIRAIIRDRNVVYDASPFVEPVLTLVLQLYHSPHWAVQNAATMAFSTLLERTAGGSRLANLSSGSAAEEASVTPTSSRRTPKFTAVEFFARYPVAHAYLTASLANATTAETASNPQLIARMLHKVTESGLLPPISTLHTTISQITEAHKEVNPWSANNATEATSHSASLYAVLLLLSRMSPSKSASTSHQQSNVEPMILLTSSAAVSSQNSKVRILASKALAPLISTPAMPIYVQSLIDALPNSPEEYAKYAGEHGAANQLHGILYLILQLLRTHMHILATVASNQNQEQSVAENDSTLPSDASFAIASAALLEQLRNAVLPSILPKLWLLRSKAAPIAAVLLSILTEFVIDPLVADSTLAKSYPAFASLATSTVLVAALHLRRKSAELTAAAKDDSVRAVLEDVMVHRQYKFYANVLIKAHLLLSSHLELTSAHLAPKSASETVSATQATLEALMSFPYYEVRLQAYKLLIAHIDSPLISHSRLGERLLQHLGFLASSADIHVETHSKCILRVIRLLNSLGERGALAQLLEKSETINAAKIFAVLQHWAHYEPIAPATGTPISRYCKTSTLQETVDESGVSSSLRQESLGFLSFFLRSYQKSCTAGKALEEYESMLTWWLDTIERHSRYELATADRFAAIVALSRHPLHFSDVPFSNLVVDYWMLVVRSLQDDEIEEREVARQTAARLLVTERASLTASSAPTPGHMIKIDADPGLISCTLACYEYLTRNVPQLPHYWTWLLTGLCPRYIDALNPTEQDMVAEWKSKLAFSSQLFEQEKANFFHEPALISQICRDHIIRIASKSLPETAAQLKQVVEGQKKEIERNLVSLVSFITARVPNPDSSSVSQLIAEWQCMYDQLFTPLYSLLIGLETLQAIYPSFTESGSITVSSQVEDALKKLIDGKAGLLHPILAGLAHRIPSVKSEASTFLFASSTMVPQIEATEFPSDTLKAMQESVELIVSKTHSSNAHSILESVSGSQIAAPNSPPAALSPTDTWGHIFNVRATPTNFLLPRPAVSLK